MAVTTTVGFAGEGIRGDLLVTITNAEPEIVVKSSIASIYGDAIQAQIQGILTRFGNPSVRVEIEDSGALPFTIEARLETALSTHLQIPIPRLPDSPTSLTRTRQRRTRLYIPGNTPKFFPHAGLYGADAIIFDLEDSVPSDEKAAALSMVRWALRELDFGDAERMVRINAGGVLEAQELVRAGAETILIPKAESPEDVLAITEAGDCLVIPIIESAKGVMRSYDIASSSPKVVALAFGIEDYTADIGARRTTAMQESLWAQNMVINSARAAGIVPLGSVFAQIDDVEGMEAYASWASQMGFEGVGVLHPSQIKPAHRGFGPTPFELEAADKIVRAFEESGGAVVSVEGQMVDAPVYERAKQLLRAKEGGGSAPLSVNECVTGRGR